MLVLGSVFSFDVMVLKGVGWELAESSAAWQRTGSLVCL